MIKKLTFGLRVAAPVAVVTVLGPGGGYRWGITAYQYAYVALAWPAANVLAVVDRLEALTTAPGGSVTLGQPLNGTSTSISWDDWTSGGVSERYTLLQAPGAEALRVAVYGESTIAVLLVLLGLACVWKMRRVRAERRRQHAVFGSADWATRREIMALRVRPGQPAFVLGTVRHGKRRYTVGVTGNRLYQNTLSVGPSGMGKSTMIKNNLLRPGEQRSIVVLDVKGDLYADTAGAFAHTHAVYRLAFRDSAHSCRWNPLAACRDYLSARAFMEGWVDNIGDTQTMSYWRNTTILLSTASILHLHAVAEREGRVATLPELADFLTRQSIDAILDALRNSPGPEACHSAAQYIENTGGDKALRAGVASSFHPIFALLEDPNIRAVLSGDDIDLTVLPDPAKRPTVIFLVVPVDEENAILRPLIAAFFSQVYRTLLGIAGRSPGQTLPRPVFLYMDEIGTCGRIPGFPDWLNVTRQARIGVALACQTLEQLADYYGETGRRKIMAGCYTKVGFAGLEQDDAEWFSKEAGQTTVLRQGHSEGDNRDGSSSTRSVSQAPSRLILPDQVARMDDQCIIVFMRTKRPLMVTQIHWHTDPLLRRRAADAASTADATTVAGADTTGADRHGRPRQGDAPTVEGHDAPALGGHDAPRYRIDWTDAE